MTDLLMAILIWIASLAGTDAGLEYGTTVAEGPGLSGAGRTAINQVPTDCVVLDSDAVVIEHDPVTGHNTWIAVTVIYACIPRYHWSGVCLDGPVYGKGHGYPSIDAADCTCQAWKAATCPGVAACTIHDAHDAGA